MFGHSNPYKFRALYNALTTREVDYLEYIRRKNLPLYSEVLIKLREKRLGGATAPILKEDETYA